MSSLHKSNKLSKTRDPRATKVSLVLYVILFNQKNLKFHTDTILTLIIVKTTSILFNKITLSFFPGHKFGLSQPTFLILCPVYRETDGQTDTDNPGSHKHSKHESSKLG